VHYVGHYNISFQNARSLQREIKKKSWKYNINIYITGMKREGMDWIDLAQGRSTLRAFVMTVMRLSSAMNVGTFWSSWVTGSYWIRNLTCN
jgi:hypothetical protein